MHSGFAFLELGTVRKKNQVNALVKILVDFSVSTIAYFFIGFSVAYGVHDGIQAGIGLDNRLFRHGVAGPDTGDAAQDGGVSTETTGDDLDGDGGVGLERAVVEGGLEGIGTGEGELMHDRSAGCQG